MDDDHIKNITHHIKKPFDHISYLLLENLDDKVYPPMALFPFFKTLIGESNIKGEED
jgi:hypothetical protein